MNNFLVKRGNEGLVSKKALQGTAEDPAGAGDTDVGDRYVKLKDLDEKEALVGSTGKKDEDQVKEKKSEGGKDGDQGGDTQEVKAEEKDAGANPEVQKLNEEVDKVGDQVEGQEAALEKVSQNKGPSKDLSFLVKDSFFPMVTVRRIPKRGLTLPLKTRGLLRKRSKQKWLLFKLKKRKKRLRSTKMRKKRRKKKRVKTRRMGTLKKMIS